MCHSPQIAAIIIHNSETDGAAQHERTLRMNMMHGELKTCKHRINAVRGQ